MYEITTSKKGISSVELSTRIGVSQKTAWLIIHKIRTMLSNTNPELLNNMVAIDESYVRGKNKNRHADKKVPHSQGRSSSDKTPVVGLIEIGGEVSTIVTDNKDAETLHQIINDNVAQGATIVTDSYRSYIGIGSAYNHIQVKRQDTGYVTVKDGNFFYTQNIENFWTHLKRGYAGIYHYMSP